jgi:hypothetical protein
MSNEKKDATLGMPHGTAAGRLRKMLLFDCLKRHGENVCVRCHEYILRIEELSIEHIKPWEGISAELFWSLENVAYSHLRCNRPHTTHGGEHHRKIGPEGTSWCVGHKQFLPVEKFYRSETRWNGYHQYCIECNSNRKFSIDRKRIPYVPMAELADAVDLNPTEKS